MPRLTLTLPPSFGNRTVEVENLRFSIGRTPENDLAIEDPSLSRRHALIETIEGRFNLSDCGSSNGTFINGRPITAPTQLEDWDVLTFGGITDVVVRFEADSLPAREIGGNSPLLRYDQQPGGTPHQPEVFSATPSRMKMPVIAVVGALSIVLIAGLALFIGRRSTGPSNLNVNKTRERSGSVDNGSVEKSDDVSSPVEGDSPGPTSDGNNLLVEAGDLSALETYASKVLASISRDTRPVLTQKPLTAINSQVQQYRGSSALAEELRGMKRALPQVAAVAKSNGVRTPLLVYVTLAKIDRDGRGDPAQAAASLCPALAKMRAVFGDELASDTLLSVAALEEGEALQSRITKLAGHVNDSPTTIRSIWYLHDHQVISEQTYNFVIRFMAMGVIAQDPQKFGVSADPLNF
jgi:hypothetical protein